MAWFIFGAKTSNSISTKTDAIFYLFFQKLHLQHKVLFVCLFVCFAFFYSLENAKKHCFSKEVVMNRTIFYWYIF